MTKSDVSTQYTDTNSIPAHVMTLSVPPSLPRPPSSFFISLLDSLLCNSSHTRSARASPPFRTPLLHPPPLQRAASTPLCVRGAPPPPPLSAHLLLHESCFTAHVPTYPSPPPPLPLAMSRSPHRRHYGWGRGGGRGGRSIPYCAAEWQDSDQVRPLVTPAETRRRQRSY